MNHAQSLLSQIASAQERISECRENDNWEELEESLRELQEEYDLLDDFD